MDVRSKKSSIDIVADRIVSYIAREHKIIAGPSEGALVDELHDSGVLTRVKTGRQNRTEFILAAVRRAVQAGDLERFDDQYGVVFALPNEWPPADLVAFSATSDEDYSLLFDPKMFRYIRNVNSMTELSFH